MGKVKHDESHFIKSPFKAVNEFERQFIKDWNDSTAQMVTDVLKYIAKETKKEINKIGK